MVTDDNGTTGENQRYWSWSTGINRFNRNRFEFIRLTCLNVTLFQPFTVEKSGEQLPTLFQPFQPSLGPVEKVDQPHQPKTIFPQ